VVGFITNPDDNGIRSLIRENKQQDRLKPVNHTEAVLRVRETGGQPTQEAVEAINRHAPYRGPERRSGKDRRKTRDRILLDTRNNRERRRNFNPSYSENGDIPVRGIDVKI